ncbi:ATP-dependent DNA helicase RecQ [Bifidobacterium sp. 82T24]|uniref:RecQ family ATP-dependent DNA helicase n=1 Tax=Bifidobacterium pluvialisilvae TaxID=2834436 RepID=UPI001C594FE3|nr:ATP-dependent DNA helicase RecQ [Bifidobacterium pluvialisilvae]MBW3088613.1 ATP-dependent DNA helicase RecQ [Bifidobacterium pluvialisilvae]
MSEARSPLSASQPAASTETHATATASASPTSTDQSTRPAKRQDVDYIPFARKALKRFFGYDDFRAGQADVVNAIMNRHDVLAILPTGAGKSVCYQLPAMGLRFTLVITPLRALMRDQVQTLVERRNIPAALIDAGTGAAERRAIYDKALAGGLRLLYVAPERLGTRDFAAFAARMPIDLIAVDEAHCVLQWGQDFRPAYLNISAFVRSLRIRPVIAAFTATATPTTRDEISGNLGQYDPVRVGTTFDRPNIRFDTRTVGRWDREDEIVAWALTHKGQCGIVYCNSRKRTEELEQALLDAGVAAAHFHARMAEADKGPVQDRFLSGDIQVMCATTAFGMGVDKPDVRWVINDGAPDSIEEYYQEAGRAGRDGKESVSLLLWDDDDFAWMEQRIGESYDNDAMDDKAQSAARAAAFERLHAMERYCRTSGCLRAELLRYFGEEPDAGKCGKCSNCCGDGGHARTLASRTSNFGSKPRHGSGSGSRSRYGSDSSHGTYGSGSSRKRFRRASDYDDIDDGYGEVSSSDGWGSSDDAQDSRGRYGGGGRGHGRGRGRRGGWKRYGSGRGSGFGHDDDDFGDSAASGRSGKDLRTSPDSVYAAIFGVDKE